MLRELQIRNFALIDELELSFEPGLNVITGETGAGKTILMAALELAVGGKASSEVIRTGEEEAAIEAVFAVGCDPLRERLSASGLESNGEELLVRRALARGGRNRIHLNGTLATLAVLESIGDCLIRVYGQHEHHTLRQSETHLGLLDSFAGHVDLLLAMRRRFDAYHQLAERLRRLVTNEQTARARAEMLRFQIKDIADAKLARKYGDSIEAILAFHGAAARELADLDLGEEGLAKLEADTAGAERAARQSAAALSKSRRAAATRLESRVAEELGVLGMKDARFEARFAA